MISVEPAAKPLRGELRMPGDKSIAHRALMFGALTSEGNTVSGLPGGDDVRRTLEILEQLGARLDRGGTNHGSTPRRTDRSIADPRAAVLIRGSLVASASPLECGDSGTTMRLLLGLLAGRGIEAVLAGDAGLSKRPMERVAEPLRKMGATVETTDGHAPVRIRGGARLRGIEHTSPIASAQVKSCVLIAGLSATGTTTVVEPHLSRDHTERMLGAMGVELVRADSGRRISIVGGQERRGISVEVPGDLSSAAFPVIAALLVPGSVVEIGGVGLNPTRTGFLEALDAMGAEVDVAIEGSSGGEPFGRIVARGSRELLPINASGEVVVRAIDELPALFAVAAFAKGRSVFRDAGELRKKESDRIAEMARGLRALGVVCEELPDGLAVEGDPARRVPGDVTVEGAGDHRIVMALACVALRASGPVTIAGEEAVSKSYPSFFRDLERLRTAGVDT